MALPRWQQNIVDAAGNVLSGAEVEIRRESDGGLASLFSDIDGATTKGNPITADSAGYAFAYLEPGIYKVTARSSDFLFSFSWRHVAVGDAVLRQELAANTVGQGSDLIAHTGTTESVTEALDKRTIYVGSVADLLSIESPIEGAHYQTTSFYAGWNATANGPSGGGIYAWSNQKPAADHNGVTILAKAKASDIGVASFYQPPISDLGGAFIKIGSGSLSILDAGVKLNETQPNSYAINAALRAAFTEKRWGKVSCPPGEIPVDAPLYLPNNSIFEGAGQQISSGATILRFILSPGEKAINFDSASESFPRGGQEIANMAIIAASVPDVREQRIRAIFCPPLTSDPDLWATTAGDWDAPDAEVVPNLISHLKFRNLYIANFAFAFDVSSYMVDISQIQTSNCGTSRFSGTSFTLSSFWPTNCLRSGLQANLTYSTYSSGSIGEGDAYGTAYNGVEVFGKSDIEFSNNADEKRASGGSAFKIYGDCSLKINHHSSVTDKTNAWAYYIDAVSGARPNVSIYDQAKNIDADGDVSEVANFFVAADPDALKNIHYNSVVNRNNAFVRRPHRLSTVNSVLADGRMRGFLPKCTATPNNVVYFSQPPAKPGADKMTVNYCGIIRADNGNAIRITIPGDLRQLGISGNKNFGFLRVTLSSVMNIDSGLIYQISNTSRSTYDLSWVSDGTNIEFSDLRTGEIFEITGDLARATGQASISSPFSAGGVMYDGIQLRLQLRPSESSENTTDFINKTSFTCLVEYSGSAVEPDNSGFVDLAVDEVARS